MFKKNLTEIIALPGKQELFIRREFDAPRELVFQAYADPDLLSQWLGPHNMEMLVEIYDFKDGGSYRYIHTDEKGNTYAFRGVFHEIAAYERIIQTFEYEGWTERGHVEFDTIKFEALPGDRTLIICQAVYQSSQDRDAMMSSGMERGVTQGHERLDLLLAKEIK